MFYIQKIQILVYIIAAFFIYSTVSKAYLPCTTADGKLGTCLDLLDCLPLLEVFKNIQRTPQESQFLRQSQCDYIGKTAYVCCHMPQDNSSSMPTNGLNLLPSSDECGYGTTTDEFPWLALVVYKKPGTYNGFHCGATLINSRYVITSAYCGTGRGIPEGWLMTGIRLDTWELGVEKIINHPNYNIRNDIALIRLNQYVTFSDLVRPVCLSSKSQVSNLDGLRLDVFRLVPTKPGARAIVKNTVEVRSLDTCRLQCGLINNFQQDTQICADSIAGFGSGSPLVVKQKLGNRDVYVLEGLISLGVKHCTMYDFHTKVGAYADWILSNIEA